MKAYGTILLLEEDFKSHINGGFNFFGMEIRVKLKKKKHSQTQGAGLFSYIVKNASLCEMLMVKEFSAALNLVMGDLPPKGCWFCKKMLTSHATPTL